MTALGRLTILCVQTVLMGREARVGAPSKLLLQGQTVAFRYFFWACWGALLALFPSFTGAQEITPFKLVGVEGYNNLRYLQNQFSSTQPSAGTATGTAANFGQSEFREELFVMTHSYVYHPNLLSLDIGIGSILQNSNFYTDSDEAKSDSMLYNFSARAKLLRDKPFQATLFYEHLNPTLNVAPGQVMTQQNTRYGADFEWLVPEIQVPLFIDFSRAHMQGSGSERVVDDQHDRFNVRASRNFGALGSTQAQYHLSQQTSLSGSNSLPIQGSTSRDQDLSIDSRFQFGPQREYNVNNLISLTSQSYTLMGSASVPERKEARFFLDMRGRSSNELQSFASINRNSNDQGELSASQTALAAGATYSPSSEWVVGTSARTETLQTPQLNANSRSLDGSVRFQQKLPLGVMEASYVQRHEQHQQEAIASETRITGERLTLAGNAYAALAQLHVSNASLVISTVTRSQSFVEGSDYLLTLVGSETRVQRLIGGTIFDGQELIADYVYDLGGTFSYNKIDQTLNLNWAIGSYVSSYARLLNSAPRLGSGLPSFPLNAVRSNVYGLRVDVPVRSRVEVLLGANIERENRRETVSSYRRETEEFYAQIEDPFFGNGQFRLSARRIRIMYDNSLQDVDLHGYGFHYGTRLQLGPELSVNLNAETDIGGAFERRRIVAALKAYWSFRKLKLWFDFGRTVEIQGVFKRTPVVLQLQVRREF